MPDGFHRYKHINKDLTPREKEIADLLCRGFTLIEITKLLNITNKTTHTHVCNCYSKYGVHSQHQLVAYHLRQNKELLYDKFREN